MNQVRADLPPEAEVPAINIEPSDSQYRVDVPELQLDHPRGEPGHRLPDPRRAAAPLGDRRRAARRHPRRAHVRHPRLAQARAHGGAQRQPGAGARRRSRANNYLSAVGQTKGALVQVNLTATTDLQSVDEFKKLVIRQQNGTLVRLEDVADVVLGADNYDQDVRFSGKKAVFMGVWVLPNANSLDVIERVRDGDGRHPEGAARRA